MKKVVLLVSFFIYAYHSFAQITIGTDNLWRCFPLVPTPAGTPPPYPNPASFTDPPNNPVGVTWTQIAHNDASWTTPTTITPASNPSNHMWTTQTTPQIWAAAFRRSFNLPAITGYHRIIVLADNFADVYINGHYLGLADWSTPDTFCIPSNFLVVGKNVIALKVGEYVNAATFFSALATFNNPVPYPCTPDICKDTCSWNTTANNIVNNKNLFGTITNNDVRLVTNSVLRGIFTNTGQFGFGTTTPGNRVEINSNGDGTTTNTGISGLRFSNMNDASATTFNPQNKVLSVNSSGDVVLVDGSGGGGGNANNGLTMNGSFAQLGQSCKQGTTGAELLDDRMIPMNSFNFSFRDGELKRYTNRVGIGINSCIPNAKLDVLRNRELENYDLLNIAISGVNLDFTEGQAIGVNGEANFEENYINIGGNFTGRYGRKITYGVIGIAESHGGDLAFGGWFSACDANRNIGVYAEACKSDNRGNGPSFAGYFNGDVFSTTGFFVSDRKIKKNIEPVTNALDLLSKIQPKKYQFDNTVYPSLKLPVTTENYGVIAQDLEQVLPSLVAETPIPDGNKGFLKETIKTVNYTELIPILIQAVKDQQAQIKEQQARIDELTTILKGNTDGKSGQTSTGRIDVVLSDKNTASLDQNVPNPCDKFTAIGFVIPATVQSAVINFTTMEGKNIKSLTITERGKGTINVYTSDLNSGTYIYSLIADGKTIDSKRMVINK